MAFEGSCHCGRLKMMVDEDMPTKGICRRKGNIHHFTAPDKVTIDADDADIGGYEFNQHKIHHQFCKACGCAPFAKGEGPDGPMVEINLRCVPDCDIDKLEIEQFDGAKL